MNSKRIGRLEEVAQCSAVQCVNCALHKQASAAVQHTQFQVVTVYLQDRTPVPASHFLVPYLPPGLIFKKNGTLKNPSLEKTKAYQKSNNNSC